MNAISTGWAKGYNYVELNGEVVFQSKDSFTRDLFAAQLKAYIYLIEQSQSTRVCDCYLCQVRKQKEANTHGSS
jgi:hypothetical protein